MDAARHGRRPALDDNKRHHHHHLTMGQNQCSKMTLSAKNTNCVPSASLGQPTDKEKVSRLLVLLTHSDGLITHLDRLYHYEAKMWGCVDIRIYIYIYIYIVYWNSYAVAM